MTGASEPTSILTFTVIAALVTTVGTLFGHYLKEAVLARSFDKWKRRTAVADVHRKFRDPVVLAAIELASRLKEIVRHYPTAFLASASLAGVADAPANLCVTHTSSGTNVKVLFID